MLALLDRLRRPERKDYGGPIPLQRISPWDYTYFSHTSEQSMRKIVYRFCTPICLSVSGQCLTISSIPCSDTGKGKVPEATMCSDLIHCSRSRENCKSSCARSVSDVDVGKMRFCLTASSNPMGITSCCRPLARKQIFRTLSIERLRPLNSSFLILWPQLFRRTLIKLAGTGGWTPRSVSPER